MDRFASLRYPIHTATQALDKAFPDLFKHKEFKRLRLRKDWEKVTRYLIYLYDHNSELSFEHEGDLKARKDAAAMEAGYMRDASGEWGASLEGIMDVSDKDFLRAVMCYLKIQKNDVWMDIIVTEQELDEFQELRMTSIKIPTKKGEENDIFEAGKKKDYLMEACSKRVKHLKNRYSEFYADHKDVQAADYDEMINPENALRIMAGTKPWEEEIEEPAVAVSDIVLQN